MKAEVDCGNCGAKTKCDFDEACENGCPVCGSQQVVIGDIEE